METQTHIAPESTTQEAPAEVTQAPTRIIKLLMDGFKSFGKRTELLFDEGFNCIMGPNGSGKSNILDSLCFVLGKSSSKSMRVEKSANLIYNGGKTKQPAKQAEVSIVFDNSQKTFPIEEDEVKITRIVRQNGQSKYKINNKTRTRQEILELLASAKIYPDGYNIILQGDIVRFVTMSGVERRQIVEEIAGISIYEDRKQNALRELGKVEGKLGEAEIILKERSGYLKDLKKDRDQAQKFKSLNDSIKQNKASYLKHQMNRKEGSVKKIEEKVGKHKATHEKILAKVKGFREEITKRRARIKEIGAEIEKSGDRGNIKLGKQIETMRVSVATKRTRQDTLKQELSKIETRRKSLEENSKELGLKQGHLQSSRKSLADRKKSLESQLTDLDQKIAAFRKKHKLDEGSATIEEKLTEIDGTIDTLGKDVQGVREKQQQLLREKDKIEFQLETIDQQIAKVKELEDQHKDEIKSLKQKKSEFKKAVLELNQLLTKDSKLAGELASLRKEVVSLEETSAKLQVKNAAMQESIAGNIAIKKIVENKKQLGAIYGTIGELGETPGKYSLALEIAAGNKINSIVVENDQVAARCINFLKKNKFGIASFLPLNKVKPSGSLIAAKKYLKHNGVHGLAIDLLKFDPKLKPAFQYVFGATLVVDSITTARKIGIGNAKMVTLDGDVCEVSGAMTGGFRKRRKGSFKDVDLADSIKRTDARIMSVRSNISKITTTRTKNEGDIQRLRELKAELEGEIIKVEKSLHLDSTDLSASKEYKEELKEELKKKDAALRELSKEVSTKTREVTKLQIEKTKLRTQMSQLRSPTVLAQLNAYDEKKNSLKEELIGLTTEEKSLDIQLKDVVGRDLENSQKVLKELDKESTQFTKESKDLEQEIKLISKELKEKEAEQAKLYSKFKKLYEERNKLGDDISGFETKAFEIEDTARKEEVRINLLSMEEAKLKAEFSGLRAEFEQYGDIKLDLSKSEEELRKEIRDFEKMRDSIGSVNMRALEIYETVQKEFDSLTEKKKVLVEEKESVEKLMAEIEGSKKERFLETLHILHEHFQSNFQELTTKGIAELELENPEDPFAGGLMIKVKLTGNKFLDIRSLSGGEKTMTALAFIFAIQDHCPATFYILDEVDAALDKSNSRKLAKLVAKYSKQAQYVVISHNDTVVGEAHTIYGISMGEHGLSNVVSLKM